MDCQQLIKNVNDNLNIVKNNGMLQPEVCIAPIRNTLESIVKLFWLEKFNKTPVFIENGQEKFKLSMAIKSEKFSNHFYDKKIILSYMDDINNRCNELLHGRLQCKVKDIDELYVKLEQCIRVIENKIDLVILEQLDLNDIKAKEIFKKLNLYENKILKGYTNHKFLNEYFKTNYGQWGSTRWELDLESNNGPQADNMIVWMGALDGKNKKITPKDEFINIDNENEIIEQMVNGKNEYKGTPIRKYAKKYPYRIIIEKSGKTYIVRGVYKFDENKSINDLRHYYIKI